jgi:C1A family cysteine protease
MKNSINSRYGWVPDRPDHRDFIYSDAAKKLPASTDLRSQCSPVEDQGQLGSCTANALVGNLEFLEIKAGKPEVDLSRLFVYYNERVIEGTVKSDSGAAIRDGVKSLTKQGVCTEQLWAYNIAKFASKPTTTCYKQALTHLLLSYSRVTTLQNMKSCLAAGYPFVFGFTVYSDFESARVAQTGIVNLPTKGETVLGGHAVMACGYDDSTQRFLVRNSWGTGWGMQGYFTIPYAYLTDSNLADDFWTLRVMENPL